MVVIFTFNKRMSVSPEFFDRYLKFKSAVDDFDPKAGGVMGGYFDHFLRLALGFRHQAERSDRELTSIGDDLRDGFLLAVRSAYHGLSTSHLYVDPNEKAPPYWSEHLVMLNDAISRVENYPANRRYYPFLQPVMDNQHGLAGAIGVDASDFDKLISDANQGMFAYHHGCLERDLIDNFDFASGPYQELQMMADFAENAGASLRDASFYASIGKDYALSHRWIFRAAEREINICHDLINDHEVSIDRLEYEDIASFVDDIALALNAVYTIQFDDWEEHPPDDLRENLRGLINNMDTELTFSELTFMTRSYPTYICYTDGPASAYLAGHNDRLGPCPLPNVN
jgi:hypothetical protein